MKYKLVKLSTLSGNKASIYSVIQDDETETFLDKFVKENKNSSLSEIKNILMRLKSIGHKTGARENFLKHLKVIRVMAYAHSMMNRKANCVCTAFDLGHSL